MNIKEKLKKHLAVLFVMCLIVSIIPVNNYEVEAASSKFIDAKAGALKVKGTKLVDKKGRTVQLRGVSTHGLSWYPQYANEKCFKELHNKWGVNVIRLAMYTSEYNGYCTSDSKNKKKLKDLIIKSVKAAKKCNMYVIIDWHILSDGNPNTYLSESKEFFHAMSKTFKNYTNVIYEICNEPNGGTTWKQIKSYAMKVIPVIKKNDKDAVVIVGTPNWSQYVNEAAKDPITKYSNIMYALHFYAGTHKAELRNTMVKAVKKKLPIFVSEFGMTDASGNGYVDKQETEKWFNTMNKYNIGYCAWSLSNKPESSALINSSCTKKYGFKKSDLSESGRWIYLMYRKYAGKTK